MWAGPIESKIKKIILKLGKNYLIETPNSNDEPIIDSSHYELYESHENYESSDDESLTLINIIKDQTNAVQE